MGGNETRRRAVHDALFKAYFVDGRNIGDSVVLVDVARSVGLPADEAADALRERRYRTGVDADWAKSREYGVTGVPCPSPKPARPIFGDCRDDPRSSSLNDRECGFGGTPGDVRSHARMTLLSKVAVRQTDEASSGSASFVAMVETADFWEGHHVTVRNGLHVSRRRARPA